MIVRVNKNFWLQNDENHIYQALYMIYDAVTSIKPKNLFQLPKIKKHLDECSRNETTYGRWGQGMGFQYTFRNNISYIFIRKENSVATLTEVIEYGKEVGAGELNVVVQKNNKHDFNCVLRIVVSLLAEAPYTYSVT